MYTFGAMPPAPAGGVVLVPFPRVLLQARRLDPSVRLTRGRKISGGWTQAALQVPGSGESNHVGGVIPPIAA